MVQLKMTMNRLSEVEKAITLMREAMQWTVMKWLLEKNRVRKAADRANAALDHQILVAKQRWPQNVTLAYKSLASSRPACQPDRSPTDQRLFTLIKKFRQAEEDAYAARASAESTFDDAEKLLSTRLAREGCTKAIEAWNLLEKAIHKAEYFSEDHFPIS